MGELYRIELPFATCGVVAEDDIVVDAAPILRWTIGKPISVLHEYVKRKHGQVTHLPCRYRPENVTGIGMHHCPDCGEMVIGGLPHGGD